MLDAYAEIRTEQPQRIMKRLSRHWGHKCPVQLGEKESRIELSLGICRLQCTDILRVELQADELQMPGLQEVVADHLQRMASSEELAIAWQQA